MRTSITSALCVAALAVVACGSGDKGAAKTQPRPSIATVAQSGQSAASGYPNAMAVLGHSGATGESSDPERPGLEVRENSWATGTNPAVKSVYQRILAKNPGIQGHASNLARGGATVLDLVRQARLAVKLAPKPQLVLVQIMDNDIACPASPHDLRTFRSRYVKALKVLARGLPGAKLFAVSQFGSPTTFWKALSAAQRRQFGGTGPCSFLDPRGRLVRKELRRLERIIHGYERQLATGCRRVDRCTYDGGAFGRVIDRPAFIAPHDPNHFSLAGHAKAAAVAFAALRRTGVLPQ